MEAVMKKSLVLLALLTAAATLFAETLSCESDLGKCTYELSVDSFSKDCTCNDGNGIGEAEISSENGIIESTLPTKEECEAELEKVCLSTGIKCENKAGECEMEPNGDYQCHCFGIEEMSFGTAEFGEKTCNDTLVELCGSKSADK